MIRNTAGQSVAFQLVARADGLDVTTGSVSVYVALDGAAQAAGAGTVTHRGQGCWIYAPTQAETNATHVAFQAVHASAVTALVNVYTRAGDAFTRLGAPVGASISADIAAVQTSATNVQSRLPAALVAGRMDASVGAMATDSISSAAVAAAAVTKIQAGLSTLTAANVGAQVDASLLAVGLTLTVTGRIDAATSSRLATASYAAPLDAAGVRTAVGLATANIDSQFAGIKAKTDLLPAAPASAIDATERNAIADALLARDLGSGLLSGPANERSVRSALRFLRNKWSLSGGTLTVTKEDDATTAWSATVTTNATAQPITGTDPA